MALPLAVPGTVCGHTTLIQSLENSPWMGILTQGCPQLGSHPSLGPSGPLSLGVPIPGIPLARGFPKLSNYIEIESCSRSWGKAWGKACHLPCLMSILLNAGHFCIKNCISYAPSISKALVFQSSIMNY